LNSISWVDEVIVLEGGRRKAAVTFKEFERRRGELLGGE
jgi:hypothetical protein